MCLLLEARHTLASISARSSLSFILDEAVKVGDEDSEVEHWKQRVELAQHARAAAANLDRFERHHWPVGQLRMPAEGRNFIGHWRQRVHHAADLRQGMMHGRTGTRVRWQLKMRNNNQTAPLKDAIAETAKTHEAVPLSLSRHGQSTSLACWYAPTSHTTSTRLRCSGTLAM